MIKGDSADDRFYPDRRRPGCEPRDPRAALEALCIFHEAFPDTLAAIQAEAQQVLATAQRLDAAAFQDGDGVSLRVMLWRLDRLICDAEEDVRGHYGEVPAPRRDTP